MVFEPPSFFEKEFLTWSRFQKGFTAVKNLRRTDQHIKTQEQAEEWLETVKKGYEACSNIKVKSGTVKECFERKPRRYVAGKWFPKQKVRCWIIILNLERV